MERIPKAIWVLALGALLILPQLGSFGLWDPSEIRHADRAAELATDGTYRDITVGGKHGPGPVLSVWLTAIGLDLLGTSELAVRLPFALIGLLGLLLAFHLGRRFSDDWGGLAAAFVLATTPGYLFQARQLGGEIVFSVAILAAVGGLTAHLLAKEGARKWPDLTIAALGLLAGSLSRGILLGWLLPLLVVGIGLLVFSSSAGASGGQRRLRSTFVAAWPGIWPLLLATAAVLALLLVYLRVPVGLSKVADAALVWPRKGAWLVLGGVLRSGASLPSFEQPLRQLGYALFPWFALLPLALGSFAWPGTGRSGSGVDGISRLPGVVVCVAGVLGYLASVAHGVAFGAGHFPALSLLALGVGLWLRRHGAHWRHADDLRWPFGAMVAACLLLALQQDFYAQPESLAFSHLLDRLTFPVKLDVRTVVRLFGLGLTAMFFVALSGVGFSSGGATPNGVAGGGSWWRRAARTVARWWRRAARAVAQWLDVASVWARPLSLVAVALFAGWSVHLLTPQLSLHMSNKALYQTYHHCRGTGEGLLGQYRVTGRGAAYYTDGKVEDVPSQTELFRRLRRSERFFAVIPAGQLGAIDQAARRQRLNYHVLDARNSKFLLISNQLTGACAKDNNPLLEMVLAERPPIAKPLKVNFEDKVELLGYDCPDVVRSGGSFKIKLYFKVLGRMPSNYKIFLHFDKPASRFHGDHKPLGEMYPTQYWLPGDYIVDTHEVELPLLTTSPGLYTIYAGFWLSSTRLKVTKGPNDGSNRVRLGRVQVRVY